MHPGNEVTICIGSTNPVKIRGVSEAFSVFYKIKGIESKKISTSVPPQPIGLDQILLGAKQRALGSMSVNCDFGVGVEAGFYLFNGEPFDVELAYVVSRDQRYSIGMSPSFPIPRRIYEAIIRGEHRELDEAVEKIFGVENIGEKEGFIGILTRMTCERYILSYYATLMALVKFLNESLYY